METKSFDYQECLHVALKTAGIGCWVVYQAFKALGMLPT